MRHVEGQSPWSAAARGRAAHALVFLAGAIISGFAGLYADGRAHAAEKAIELAQGYQQSPDDNKKKNKGEDKADKKSQKLEEKSEQKQQKIDQKQQRLQDKADRKQEKLQQKVDKKQETYQEKIEKKEQKHEQKIEANPALKEKIDRKQQKYEEKVDRKQEQLDQKIDKKQEKLEEKVDRKQEHLEDKAERRQEKYDKKIDKIEDRTGRRSTPDGDKKGQTYGAAPLGQTYAKPPKSQKKFDDVKRTRKQKIEDGGKRVVIREPDKRIIVKQDNRFVIQHDEAERLRRLNRGVKTNIIAGGHRETVFVKPNGIKVVDVTDKYGRIVYRYKVVPGGRRIILIDNRHYWRRHHHVSGSDFAIGLLVGAAIVALAPPVIGIPHDHYIVDYGYASDDDIYLALSAPPVEVLDRRYSLEEIRYSDSLRQRMRRVDLDTVTFDFGSWEVSPEQYGTLERIARGINRLLEDNPDEVVLVEGHTDAVGSEEDNLSLSDRRAQNVAEILSAEFDVPPENLVTQGYGEEFLKVPTDGPERRNRRITVRRITPLLSQEETEP